MLKKLILDSLEKYGDRLLLETTTESFTGNRLLYDLHGLPELPVGRMGISMKNSYQWIVCTLGAILRDRQPVLLNPSVPSVLGQQIAEKLKISTVIGEDWLSAQTLVVPLDDPLKEQQEIPAFHLLTSGTTGTPKLSGRSHQSLVYQVPHLVKAFHLTEQSRVLALPPFFHSYGVEGILINTIAAGGTLVLPTPATFGMALAEQIDKAGVTHVFANPPLVHLLMAYRKENKNAFATLRHVISGGALVEEKMAKQFHQLFDFQVATVYGMSEVGCVAVSDGEPCINGYSGRLLTGYQGRVMSTEGKELPLGKMGILWIKKPFKEFGYTDLPEISAKQFDGDWFLTGDMGHLDDQGNVFLAGVRSGRINVGGEKVDPGFVEMELKKCDGVEEAVVFGVPHSVYGEVVHAAVSGSNLEEETLREQLRTRVDPASLPRKIECTTTPLKRTPSGKISRVLYRQLFVDLQN